MTCALALALCAACLPEGPPLRAPDGPIDPPPRRIIYQLLVRTFGNDRGVNLSNGTLEQNGSGTYDDIDGPAIEAIRGLGATHVWLTGVPRQASLTAYPALGIAAEDPDVVKGRAGSPYAIIDYFDTSPDYARDPARRLEAFRAAVDRLHAAGLKVLIDLVPNHVARGYRSSVRPDDDFGVGDDPTRFFAPDNSFFYLTDPPGQALRLSSGPWSVPGMDGSFPREDGSSPARTPRATGNNVTSPAPGAYDWYETVKLNWGYNFVTGETRFHPVPRTWQRMDAVLAEWQSRGVDGFRCDFAHYVPIAAWQWLVAQARARDPSVEFYAEAYAAADAAPHSNKPNMLLAGFDGTYDDPPYDAVRAVVRGEASANDLDGLMADDFMRDRVVRYVENHDEPRAAAPVRISGSEGGFGSVEAGLAGAALLYLSANGPLLLYAGQELGERAEGAEGFGGDDGRTSIFDYWSMPTTAAFKRVGWAPEALSEPMRALRARYADLLAVAKGQAFRAGTQYYGLSYVNRDQASFGDYGRRVTAFLRYRPGGQVCLVFISLDGARSFQTRIRIPRRALVFAGLGDAERLRFGSLLGDAPARETAAATLPNGGVEVELPPYGVVVYELSEVP